MPPFPCVKLRLPLGADRTVFLLPVFSQDDEGDALKRKRSKGGLEDSEKEAESDHFKDRWMSKRRCSARSRRCGSECGSEYTPHGIKNKPKNIKRQSTIVKDAETAE